MEELLQVAASLAGRDVEVEQTNDGQFIAAWFSFGLPPPPKADTPEKALQGFISMMLNMPPSDATIEPDSPGDTADEARAGPTGNGAAQD